MKSSPYRRRILQRALICLPTFDRPDGICDFVFQTARELSHQNVVIILALGENWRGKSGFRKWAKAVRNISTGSPQEVTVGLLHILPFQRWQVMKKLNLALNVWLLNLCAFSKISVSSKLLWVFQPQDAVVLPLFSDGWHIHYDVVDWHTSVDPLRQQEIERFRQLIFKRARTVTVLTEEAKKRVQKQFAGHIEKVPQGFDAEVFLRGKARHTLRKLLTTLNAKKRPIIGFFGGINQRLDWNLLAKVISLRPHDLFLFVGPISEDDAVVQPANFSVLRQSILSLPNVQHVDTVPRSSLLALMQACDVLLIPYAMRSEFNTCCFPMKAMEYMAAERPIVATPISSLTNFSLVKKGKSASEFLKAIDESLHHPFTAKERKLSSQLAQQQTWQQKLDCVDRYLDRMIRSA